MKSSLVLSSIYTFYLQYLLKVVERILPSCVYCTECGMFPNFHSNPSGFLSIFIIYNNQAIIYHPLRSLCDLLEFVLGVNRLVCHDTPQYNCTLESRAHVPTSRERYRDHRETWHSGFLSSLYVLV